MASEMLRKAHRYEEIHRPRIREELPVFHVTGGVGWINDPNGFAPYKGEYHLFFQYYPYDVQWGPMHWGHVKTRDFIRWEFLPCALAPDMEYDKDGCFSGGAVELPDGRHLLMYTGVRKVETEEGKVEDRQTQCIAIGNGVDYEKSERNPVITGADLPEGGSIIDFRDPKIWREGDTFYAVIVNRGANGSGTVLLYESSDGTHWKLNGNICQCNNRYGRMWECPDIFSLDGKDVLIHSAQDMRAEGLEYHAGNGKVYHIGKLDRENLKFRDEVIRAMEYGLDFYAPQTMETEDGRRIMIGWMQCWESSRQLPDDLHFMGQMTLPRELHIKNNRLCQWPVRELENYRAGKVSYHNVQVQGETTLPGVCGRVLDLSLRIRPAEESGYGRFDLEFAKDEDNRCVISLFPETGTIRMDRTYSGFRHDVITTREFYADFSGGEIRLRLILDRYSAELFVGEGEQASSMVIYTPESADGICMKSDRPVLVDMEKYDIRISSQEPDKDNN